MKITQEMSDCMTELYEVFNRQSPSFSSRQKWSNIVDRFQKILENVKELPEGFEITFDKDKEDVKEG